MSVGGGTSVSARPGNGGAHVMQVMPLLSPQREPTLDLLEAFVEHWKGITHYYIESTGEAWSSLQGAGRTVRADHSAAQRHRSPREGDICPFEGGAL